MQNPLTPKNTGYFVANSVALLLIGIPSILRFFRILQWQNHGLLIFSEFVIVPMLMGVISAYFWRDLSLTTRQLVGASCLNALFAILLSFIFLGEGSICLIIVSPLLMVFTVTGAFIGQAIFKRKNQTLNVSLFATLLVIFVFDSLSVHSYENIVTDTIIVNAPPAKVWEYVVAYKRIEAKDKYWLFKLGMPSPIQSTADGYYLGANRKCIFSNGYVFDEKIITYDENKNLTFAITNQPRDPEIMGHIDIQKGQFILTDNGDGTTTLTGNSWYKLYVFPVWYYDMWAESITRNVHIKVMDHIKLLSEAK